MSETGSDITLGYTLDDSRCSGCCCKVHFIEADGVVPQVISSYTVSTLEKADLVGMPDLELFPVIILFSLCNVALPYFAKVHCDLIYKVHYRTGFGL